MRATLLVACCLASSACATSPGRGDSSVNPYDRPGAYVAAGAIYGIEAFEDPSVLPDVGNSNPGAVLRIGTRAANGSAIEIYGEDVPGFRLDAPNGGTHLTIKSAGLNGKLYFRDEAVQPYLLVGGGWSQARVADRTPFVPPRQFDRFEFPDDGAYARGGLGVDVYLTETLALFFEGHYNWYPSRLGHLKGLDYYQAVGGILIRF